MRKRNSKNTMKPKKIKKTLLQELIRQNARMRQLLESWPAREIMMDFEKEWNEKREQFLSSHVPPSLEFRD